MSDTYFSDGAAESCAINEQDQALTEKCGQNGPIDPQKEFSAAPAPISALREKLRQIRDSDHPASPWARNVVQCMDEIEAAKKLGKQPDAAQVAQLGRNVAMFERMIGAARPDWTVHILTADEIASIFGLGDQS